MTIFYFPAFVRQLDQAYEVAFADLPDCTSMGATIQEAVRHAEVALTAHLRMLQDQGVDVPQPSDLGAMTHGAGEEVVRVLVRAELPNRKAAVTLMLDEALLNAIDVVSPDRANFLENAAREMLRRHLQR